MQLQYEIDGVKYLLCDIPVWKKKNGEKLELLIQKYKGIMQGAKVCQSFWFNTIIYARVLIPEHKALQFQSEWRD